MKTAIGNPFGKFDSLLRQSRQLVEEYEPGPLPLLKSLSDCSPVANVSSEKPRIALKVSLDMQHSDLRLVAEKADPTYFQQTGISVEAGIKAP